MLWGFEEYLVRKATLNEKYIPYYVKWVSQATAAPRSPQQKALLPLRIALTIIPLKKGPRKQSLV